MSAICGIFATILASMSPGEMTSAIELKKNEITPAEIVDSGLSYSRRVVYDLEGNPSYYIYDAGSQYFIVSKKEGTILEKGIDNPYKNGKGVPVYDQNSHGFKTLETDGDNIWSAEFPEISEKVASYGVSDQEYFDSQKIVKKRPEFGKPSQEEVIADFVTAKKVPNYEYFLRLYGHHGYNDSNICSLIANQILLGYWDTFSNDDVIPEEWDFVPSEPYLGDLDRHYLGFSTQPGGGSQDDRLQNPGSLADADPQVRSDSRMRDALLEDCEKNVDSEVTSHGLTVGKQRKALERYLKQRGLQYKISSSAYTLSDLNGRKAWKMIRQSIDEGRPILANAWSHSVVAFAYDDTHVYCCNGWGDAVQVSSYQFYHWRLNYVPSAIDVNILDSQTAFNYYSTATDKFYSEYEEECSTNSLGVASGDVPVFSSRSSTTFNRSWTDTSVTCTAVGTSHSLSSGPIKLITGGSEDSTLKITATKGKIKGIYFEAMSGYQGSTCPNYTLEWGKDSLTTVNYSLRDLTILPLRGKRVFKALNMDSASFFEFKLPKDSGSGSFLNIYQINIWIE